MPEGMMKNGKFVATLYMLGLLAALISTADAAEVTDVDKAAQNAVTRSEHEAVARYYEDAARDLLAKEQEQKSLLEQYESKSYLYGRNAQDLQARTYAMIHKYDQAAKANIKEAGLHRQMALNAGEYQAEPGVQMLSAR